MKHDKVTPLYIQFDSFAKECNLNEEQIDKLLHLSRTAYIVGSDTAYKSFTTNPPPSVNGEEKE